MRAAMRRTFTPVALVVLLSSSGCGTWFAPKMETPPAPQSSSEAWHLTKLVYQGALGSMTEWARTVEQGGSATPNERLVIDQAAKIHEQAMTVIVEGDAITTGDYTTVIVRLNRLIVQLQQRYATRTGATPIAPAGGGQ